MTDIPEIIATAIHIRGREVKMKNAQLWKRILNEGIVNSGDEHQIRIIEALKTSVILAPIIVDSMGFECFDLPIAEISIPFPRFWLEGEYYGGGQYGCFVEVDDRDDGSKSMRIFGFFCSPKLAPMLCVLHEGIILKGGMPDAGTFRQQLSLQCDPGNAAMKLAGNMLSLCFRALGMLSCKNVSLSPRDHEDPKQAKRAAKRFGGDPDYYKYHVLVVRTPGAKSGDKSQEQEISTMPRHVCRGHFSEYGPEFGKGLLFGKYAGRFYVPPHLKGDKKNGTVEKDYEIQ